MTNQEAFDIVVKHLLTQKKKSQGLSYSGTTICQYHDLYGNKCAIGIFIPESDYYSDMDGLRLQDVIDMRPELREVSKNLLLDLRATHDCVEVGLWQEQLNHLAQHYNLTMPTL